MLEAPLKILLTDPHLKGGGQVRYVTNLAAALTRMGHSVAIGCKPDSILVDKAREAGCEVRNEFTFRGGLRPRAWKHDLAAMRAYIRSELPDIIHASGSQDHWVAASANKSLQRPVCLVRTRHNTYRVSDALPNRVLNRKWTDYQIVVCDMVRRQLASQAAFRAERLCTIHNGVDATLYQPDPEARARVRAEFGYEDDHIVVGIAARLVVAKGHSFLFKAASMLVREFPKMRLLVLGQGPLEETLKQSALICGLGGIIRFAGFREDMPACVQAFDIGVQPSIDCDTSSFALKEQMAAGKPVIASDYGGLTEIVTDGGEGYIVPAGSISPLAAALTKLLRDPQKRAAMGEKARERVLQEFTIQAFAEKTVAAYRTALELHRALAAH